VPGGPGESDGESGSGFFGEKNSGPVIKELK
jgi:hypothetical protein